MAKFILINKARSGIKVFKRTSKLVMKSSRVESIEEERNEYKKILEKGGNLKIQ